MKHPSGSGEQRRPNISRNSEPRQASYQKAPRDKRPRWVVAIYDYDPTTMSPNPDVCDEELPFKEGEHIKVCYSAPNSNKIKILIDFHNFLFIDIRRQRSRWFLLG